ANTGWIVYSTTYPTHQMGRVQKTTDGGANWTTAREADISEHAWNDMEFIDASVGYACGENGIIYKTTDGGVNWTLVSDTNACKVELYNLDVVSATVVYAAGKNSTILKTTDGSSFTKLSYNFDGDMANADTTRDDLDGGLAFINENRGVVAVDFTKEATIWWTEDGGTTWHPVKVASAFPTGVSSHRVYDVAVGGDSTVALAAYHHACLISTNGGRTFTTKSPFSLGYVYSKYAEVIDNNTIICGGGSDNLIMKTTDAGANWDTLNVGTGQTLASADFIDASTGYLFCDDQQWFKTVNGGVNWTPLNTWPGVGFWGLAFPTTDKIVLTASSGGEMTVSNDGGKTWSYPDNLKTKIDTGIFECEFIDANNGLMGGTGGNLLKTTDSGANLVPIVNPMYDAGKAINAIHYLNADTVFAGGGSGNLMHSFNGGATWTKTTAGTKTVYDILPLAGNQIVTTCASGEYYTSTDGMTFTKLGATTEAQSLRAIKFRNGIGIIPGAKGYIYRSTTWNVLPTLVYTASNGAELYDVEFVDDTTVFVVGQYGTILKSVDAGLNWTVETSPTEEVLQKVRYSDGTLWAVGQNGTILKNDIVSKVLAGDYYIPQGSHEQGFATLGEAVTTLNTYGASAPVNFLLDADTLREASFTFNAPLSAENNVVVKPAPGRNVCLIVAPGVSRGNGPQMIGFDKGFVTFDGSNNGTSSRNLIVTNEVYADVPFGLNTANADTVVLKNLIIKNLDNGIKNFKYGAVTNDVAGIAGFTVENCQIGSAEFPVWRDGVAVWGSSSGPTQGIVINNDIYAGSRGIGTYVVNDCVFSGNTINMMPVTSATTYAYIHGIYLTGASGPTEIHNNTINCLEAATVTGTYIIGIAFAGNSEGAGEIISIVNNMINVGAVSETHNTYGIGFRSANPMGNIQAYHNTILINNNASTLTSHAVGSHTNGTGSVEIDLQNNIIINNHAGNIASSAIGLIPATSVLNSDHNLLVSNQNFVNYKGTIYADLVAWQATGQDENSVSKAVEFVSATDLHLTGASIGDNDLAGMPLSTIIVADIDGETRSPTAPYMGADEGSVPLIHVGIATNNADLPTKFSLNQNYPNPFNPTTTIEFALPKSSRVTLAVYNMRGQQVAVLQNGFMEAGYYHFNFEAGNLPSGMYIYRIQAGEFHSVKKMTIMK
ncbi:MAG: hypothetical protein COT43_00245, partial [Candidatus Marinimicrobia bacterium CG08_land_8_20_14_0_20_45_22]